MLDITTVTDFEQHIYNTHLKVSRQKRNQPFKYRKDFNDLDIKQISYLKKIALFFKNFPHIKIEEFIKAPYNIYSDEQYFDLQYYTTLKATKAYTLYHQKLLMKSPDSIEQLENIQSSLLFISNFCREQNITVCDYINHKTNDTFSFLLHLKDHGVNVYCLFGYDLFDKNLRTVDSELLSFIIGSDLINNLSIFRTKFLNSNKARKFVNLGLQKITQKNNCIN